MDTEELEPTDEKKGRVERKKEERVLDTEELQPTEEKKGRVERKKERGKSVGYRST